MHYSKTSYNLQVLLFPAYETKFLAEKSGFKTKNTLRAPFKIQPSLGYHAVSKIRNTKPYGGVLKTVTHCHTHPHTFSHTVTGSTL